MRTREHGLRRRGGFTLVEVLVAAALSVVVLAAVFGALIFLTRSGLRIGHYNDMESQSRRVVQQFSQDVRQAENASWANANTLTLTVAGVPVTYAYDAAERTLSRAEAGGAPVALAGGIAEFSFRAFQVTGVELPLASSPGAAGASAKMIQINLNFSRGNASEGSATGQLISARSVMRNKKIN